MCSPTRLYSIGMYLIFASWCERFLWRVFVAQFLFYPLFLRLFVSLSLSRLSWSKKPPAPFVFFWLFPFLWTGPWECKKAKLTGDRFKKKKSRRQLFRPRFQSAFVSSSTNPLVFGLCAEKFHRDEKNHILTHALQLQEKCLSQFPPLLAPESSPRRTSAPLPPREEPPRCKSSRKENYGGFAMFFFNTKIASASARARVLEH